MPTRTTFARQPAGPAASSVSSGTWKRGSESPGRSGRATYFGRTGFPRGRSRWQPNVKEKTMSEFTYLFRGGLSSASPEQREKHLGKWVAWFSELGAKGVISDPRNPPGHPLENVGKVVRGSEKNVTDGPYAEAKDIVGGYILVNARDLAHAV